jgi:hypothetical protein
MRLNSVMFSVLIEPVLTFVLETVMFSVLSLFYLPLRVMFSVLVKPFIFVLERVMFSMLIEPLLTFVLEREKFGRQRPETSVSNMGVTQELSSAQ